MHNKIKLMQEWVEQSGVKQLLLAVVIVVGFPYIALAVTSSPSYEAGEMEFGAGSALETCSGKYCAKASIGDMSAGSSSSPSYKAEFGEVAPGSDPFIEVIVEPGQSNLGVLEMTKTATKETVVKIRSHLSSGYTLQIIGDAPKYGNHQLHTPTSPTPSRPGSEQFAINLAKNTTPSIGAQPLQVPENQGAYGAVEDGYSEADKFQYKSGAVVARSSSESGQTHYTVSMIVNIAGSTPAGHYAADFSALIIPAY